MRVLVASWTTRHAGGVESYVEKIIPALRGAGLDVSFFHEIDGPSDRARINIGDAEVFNAAASGVDAAISSVEAWKPDVMYLQGLRDPHTFDRLTAIAPSVSFVHTYFGTCISGSKTHTRPDAVPCAKRFGPMCLVHYFPRGCGGRSPVTMWQLYQKERHRLATLRKQNAVITHSAHMQRELAAHGVACDIIPFAAYAVSRNGTARDSTPQKSSDILFAGRMDHLKGGVLLMDAMRAVRQRLGRPVRVVFAGDGPDRKHWQLRGKAIADDDPDIAIAFTGWCDEARLDAVMRESRLLVVPSIWPEPFGSVGMAAAQHGVPCAAFAVGGIPQWLHEGVNGHLASASPPTSEGLANAIVTCLDEPGHYEHLSRGARRMAEAFTMDRHVPELVRVLERVIDGRR